MNNAPHPNETPAEPRMDYCKTRSGQWVKIVRGMIHGLNYGEVQLAVKDGEVVEVRKLEKIRFDHKPPRISK